MEPLGLNPTTAPRSVHAVARVFLVVAPAAQDLYYYRLVRVQPTLR